MDSHNDLLGELASDAALERSDFIVQATEQLRRFLDHHKERIAVLGGLTLIDEEPDYLSIAPDLSFRSRSRYLDDVTGEWVSETEVIESASELVELYNPADIYAAFAEAAREAAGPARRADRRGRPARGGRDLARRGRLAERGSRTPPPPTRGPSSQPVSLSEDDDESAARRLYDLALEYQERSQRSEARLLDEFEGASAGLVSVIGDLIIVDDDDERLSLTTTGVQGRGHPGGLRRGVADAQRRRGAGRVLRPDRRLRRPGRRARRGLPGRRPGAGRRVDATAPARGLKPPGTSNRRRPPPPTATPRTNPPRDDAARCRGAGRESGDPAGPVAAGVSRAGPGGRLAGRPVRPCPARRLLRDGPAPAVLAEHGRCRDRHRDHPLPGHRPGHGLVHPAAAGRRGRPARTARAAVRGGPAQPAPAARRRRAGHGRGPDAGRRGDPRRAPGDAAVRRRVGARGLPVDAAAGRGRVHRRDRRRLARPPRLRHRPGGGVRGAGPTRRSRAARPRCSRRWPGSRPGGAIGSGSPSSGASVAPARPIPSARRPRDGRRSSRCRWSRTWAAPSGPASAASSWARPACRSASAARGRSSPPRRSPGRTRW